MIIVSPERSPAGVMTSRLSVMSIAVSEPDTSNRVSVVKPSFLHDDRKVSPFDPLDHSTLHWAG